MPLLLVRHGIAITFTVKLFKGESMCLICVEYYFKRMTKEEVTKALPEMVLFAKTEEERNHFKKLQSTGSADEMESLVEAYIAKNPGKAKDRNDKNEYKASYKTRRT